MVGKGVLLVNSNYLGAKDGQGGSGGRQQPPAVPGWPGAAQAAPWQQFSVR